MKNKDGEPLHYAAIFGGRTDIVKLLDAGADKDEGQGGLDATA